MRNIVPIDHPALRAQALEVDLTAIASKEIQEIISDLKSTLTSERFGVAIAAPQIGEAVRIFIVGGEAFASREDVEYDSEAHPDYVYINPKILKISKKMKMGDEGCLSVPNKYGTKVARTDKITIEYYDENGKKHVRGASNFLARIFQHEIDHLNGILYTDEAIEVIDVDDELKPLDE
ncbi:peptide deformylase [Candidatus Kaiserbacteria bacterium]|nr:MAG: peptide deformylase [Candidatus Kaiserbacteria bacterium]